MSARARFLSGIVAAALVSRPLAAQQPLTVDEAVREARAANAALPLADFDARIARARVQEVRGARWPVLGLEGDVHDGTPRTYATGDALFVAAAQAPLYDGGGLRAAVRIARAEALAAGARYRLTEKDLDFEVRARFSELSRLEEEVTILRDGVQRLAAYLAVIEAQQAAGQGVAGDVLRTRVRLGDEQAAVTGAERQAARARLGLNDLLGRAPDSPLVLAPLGPPPQPPPPPSPPADSATTWLRVPDVAQAAADREAAGAAVAAARAERRPHLVLTADAGAQPSLTNGPAPLNNGRGWGAEFTVSLSWPLWDVGAYRARLTQAELGADRARQTEVVARRAARLAWTGARTDLEALGAEVAARESNVPLARDSYLHAQALYGGGAATALDVLDAYDAWISAREAAADAVLAFRIADAQLERWGTP